VLGRPVTDSPDYDIEIVCGARRHAAAIALGRDLLVELRVISDAEAYIAMYEENAERKDDCPYVQGQILRRAMLSGTYSCQDELAFGFNLSHSKASRLLMVAQLPSIVVAAFESPEEIRESWGVELYQIWKSKDPQHTLTDRARALAGRRPRLPAREIYNALITASGGNQTRYPLNRSTPVRGRRGVILFREQDQIGSVTFSIPKEILNCNRRAALKQAMIHILDANSIEIPSEHQGHDNSQPESSR
jgi:ParB/RepB/Spo0J family partition protein